MPKSAREIYLQVRRPGVKAIQPLLVHLRPQDWRHDAITVGHAIQSVIAIDREVVARLDHERASVVLDLRARFADPDPLPMALATAREFAVHADRYLLRRFPAEQTPIISRRRFRMRA